MSDRGQFIIMQPDNGTEEGFLKFNNIPVKDTGRGVLQFNDVQVKSQVKMSDEGWNVMLQRAYFPATVLDALLIPKR